MTFKTFTKKFAFASTAVLALSVLTNTGEFVAKAVTTTVSDSVSNGEVAIYAQQAAPTMSGSTQTNASGNNDGSQQSGLEGTPSAGVTMAGVTFTATKASGVPTQNSDGTISYTADSSTAVITKTSDASAVADFTGLTDGYWVFHQLTTVGGIATVSDFVVQVNTNDKSAGAVNVYPKLNMQKNSGIYDIATTNADANNNTTTGTPNSIAAPNALTGGVTDVNSSDASDGTAVAGNATTAANGNTVTFNVNAAWSASQVSSVNATGGPTAGTFVINDTISGPSAGGLTLATTAPVLNVVDSTGAVVGQITLTAADYTVSGNVITVTLSAAEQEQVASLLGNANGTLNLQVATTVADGTVGAFTDNPSTTVTNAYGVDLSTSADGAGSTVNVGGIDFTKEDNTTSAALSGATFVLVKADTEADAQALIKANASAFDNTTGNIASLPTAVSNNASFVTNAEGQIISTTTDTNGLGSFTGLNLVDANTDNSNTTNYFAVEVAAPKGYALPSANTGANVFGAENANTTPAATDNTITNGKPFALPFTGGAGIAAIIIMATIGGIAAFVIRRKKTDDEEVMID